MDVPSKQVLVHSGRLGYKLSEVKRLATVI